MTETPTRCEWPGMAGNPMYEAYHDTEWGVPEYDSRALWEKLVLDGFQAGLAWITILRKRDAFRAAFDDFEEHPANGDCVEVDELALAVTVIKKVQFLKG